MKNLICKLPENVFTIGMIVLVVLCASLQLFAQDDDFWVVYGRRMNYEVEIPCRFYYKKPVGKNIDFNFVDGRGNSINVLVVSFPEFTQEATIQSMASVPDAVFVEEMEATGGSVISVINRGITWYGGREYYFAYYTSTVSGAHGTFTLYHHTIAQIKDNTLVTLSYMCNFNDRVVEMPYIYRVMQSFKIKWG